MRARHTVPFLIAAAVVAGFGIARPHAQPDPRVFDATTAHGVVDGKPDRPTGLFSPDDNPIYVWFRAERCAIGTTIRSVWYYEETDPPLRFSEGSVMVEVLDDWGQFNFELSPGKRWPIGDYRVELWVADALVAATTFRVAASTRDHG